MNWLIQKYILKQKTVSCKNFFSLLFYCPVYVCSHTINKLAWYELKNTMLQIYVLMNPWSVKFKINQTKYMSWWIFLLESIQNTLFCRCFLSCELFFFCFLIFFKKTYYQKKKIKILHIQFWYSTGTQACENNEKVDWCYTPQMKLSN